MAGRGPGAAGSTNSAPAGVTNAAPGGRRSFDFSAFTRVLLEDLIPFVECQFPHLV